MRSRWTLRCAGLLALVVGLAAGCGEQPKNPVVKVEGKLLFADGKPLPPGTKLLFNPGEGGTGTASGVTAEDGSVKVTHVNGSDGAEVGKYTVLLRAPDDDKGQFDKLVPREYCDGGVFAVEVKEGMPPLALKVKRRK